jgi:hypothetical protein
MAQQTVRASLVVTERSYFLKTLHSVVSAEGPGWEFSHHVQEFLWVEGKSVQRKP